MRNNKIQGLYVPIFYYCLLAVIAIVVLVYMGLQEHNYKGRLAEQSKQIAVLREDNNKLLDRIKTLEAENKALQNSLLNSGWCMANGKSTAYSPHDNQSGIEAEGDGKVTSTGIAPGDGIIAVDPTRIPYGSEMVVVYDDGTVYKGIAGDTGGAMRQSRGLLIDIYKDTYKETVEYGTKSVLIFWKVKEETTQ